MRWYKNYNQNGALLVEVIIVAAVVVIGLAGILGLAAFSVVVADIAEQTNQATLLAQEVVEAVGNFRDGTDWGTNGLGTLAPAADYYPDASGGAWHITAGTETIGAFTRSVALRNVCRDSATDDITGITDTGGTSMTCVSSGGAYDADTLEATASVSWTERGRSHQVEIVKYFTNWN